MWMIKHPTKNSLHEDFVYLIVPDEPEVVEGTFQPGPWSQRIPDEVALDILGDRTLHVGQVAEISVSRGDRFGI